MSNLETKKTTLKRLEEVIKTINLRVIKEIEVREFRSNSASELPDWITFKIGVSIYELFVADVDPWYHTRSVELVKIHLFDLIEELGLELKIKD